MNQTSEIEIDLSALDENLGAWRGAMGGGCEVCAVVKADAYGLGVVPIARRLVSSGVKLLAVYSVAQATEVVKAGIAADILILMPVDEISRSDLLYRAVVDGRLQLTVHSGEQLDRIEAVGKLFGAPIGVHVEVDTGMSRAGMPAGEAGEVLGRIAERRYVRLAGVFTHAASADTNAMYTERQFEAFEEFLEWNAERIGPDAAVHFAGTCAAVRDPRYHKTMVRLGLGLLGYGVEGVKGAVAEPWPELRPIVRWTSSIVHVLRVPTGASVGYHGLFKTKRESRLAIVPVGHADGYPLSLSNRGVVRVGDDLAVAPVRGQVNMDQIIIDLTDLPESEAGVGTGVELISNDAGAVNSLPRLAETAGSSCYEMLCRLSGRVRRRYVTMDHATGRVGHVATV